MLGIVTGGPTSWRLRLCNGSVFNGLYSLFTCFISIRIICTIRFCLVSSVVTYRPAPTFVNHLVRYSLSLIYKGVRLYARVTNLGPEGKRIFQSAVSFLPEFATLQRYGPFCPRFDNSLEEGADLVRLVAKKPSTGTGGQEASSLDRGSQSKLCSNES